MNTPLFDYYGACEDLRQIIDRAYKAAHKPVVSASVFSFAEEVSQLWQEFYALA